MGLLACVSRAVPMLTLLRGGFPFETVGFLLSTFVCGFSAIVSSVLRECVCSSLFYFLFFALWKWKMCFYLLSFALDCIGKSICFCGAMEKFTL